MGSSRGQQHKRASLGGKGTKVYHCISNNFNEFRAEMQEIKEMKENTKSKTIL